jgi:thiamine pyrophosphate-dependent acetolactate synthase large subunit-like protein
MFRVTIVNRYRRIAAGFGVGGALVAKGSDIADALVKAIDVVQRERKPYVLEVLTEPTPKDQPRLDPLFARQGGTDDPIFWDRGPA